MRRISSDDNEGQMENDIEGHFLFEDPFGRSGGSLEAVFRRPDYARASQHQFYGTLF